jgi:hypothetical protein
MEIPTIEPQDIAHFYSLHDEFKAMQVEAGVALDLAQANKEIEITIARDGRPTVVKENDLWTEVWHLGPQCEGGTILSEKYPDAFKLAARAEAKKNDMKAFAVSKWQIDPLGMTLADIMRRTEAIVNYRLAQK